MSFIQAESQFNLSNITVDSTKLNNVISARVKDELAVVSDLILNPFKAEAYDALKERLLAQFLKNQHLRVSENNSLEWIWGIKNHEVCHTK